MSIIQSSFKSSRARALTLFSEFCYDSDMMPDDVMFPKLLDLVLHVHETAYFDGQSEDDGELPF